MDKLQEPSWCSRWSFSALDFHLYVPHIRQLDLHTLPSFGCLSISSSSSRYLINLSWILSPPRNSHSWLSICFTELAKPLNYLSVRSAFESFMGSLLRCTLSMVSSFFSMTTAQRESAEALSEIQEDSCMSRKDPNIPQ
jgi:hypothetical protein